MSAVVVSLLARLREAGATLTPSREGRVHFAAPGPLPSSLLAEARLHRDAIARLLTGSSDLGTDPSGPCPGCGAVLWWRVSILSGGPGPWHCQRCRPPAADDWTDACAFPKAQA